MSIESLARKASRKLDAEPVTLPQAVTAALIATVNLLALLFGWDEAVTAAINIMLAAWVLVVSVWSRSRVSPARGGS